LELLREDKSKEQVDQLFKLLPKFKVLDLELVEVMLLQHIADLHTQLPLAMLVNQLQPLNMLLQEVELEELLMLLEDKMDMSQLLVVTKDMLQLLEDKQDTSLDMEDKQDT